MSFVRKYGDHFRAGHTIKPRAIVDLTSRADCSCGAVLELTFPEMMGAQDVATSPVYTDGLRSLELEVMTSDERCPPELLLAAIRERINELFVYFGDESPSNVFGYPTEAQMEGDKVVVIVRLLDVPISGRVFALLKGLAKKNAELGQPVCKLVLEPQGKILSKIGETTSKIRLTGLKATTHGSSAAV